MNECEVVSVEVISTEIEHEEAAKNMMKSLTTGGAPVHVEVDGDSFIVTYQ